jgi:hypothetical protein
MMNDEREVLAGIISLPLTHKRYVGVEERSRKYFPRLFLLTSEFSRVSLAEVRPPLQRDRTLTCK